MESQSDRTLPRSVLVAEDSFYREILHSSDLVAMLDNRDAMVIPASGRAEVYEKESAAIRAVLVSAGQLIPNALLVRNPYEAASYEFAADAVEAFSNAKYHALANVARLLGAREIKFVDAQADQSSSSWAADVMAKIPIGGGGSKATNDVTKKLEKKLEGSMTFPGGEPAPADALAYLRRRNLSNDQQLQDLVEMRTGTNLISHYRMRLSGTRESAANLESALNIANVGPAKAISIGGNFTKTADALSSIEITTEITF